MCVGKMQVQQRDDESHWVHGINLDQRPDFRAIAQKIRSAGAHADELVAQRFEELADDRRYLRFETVESYLRLAKGIRNMMVHQSGWPADLHGVAQFLAKIVVYAFMACAHWSNFR